MPRSVSPPDAPARIDYSAYEIEGIHRDHYKKLIESLVARGLLYYHGSAIDPPFTVMYATRLGADFYAWLTEGAG